MIKAEVAGIPLKTFQDPIAEALEKYEAKTVDVGNRVGFDIKAAANLEMADDRPYTARSQSKVQYLGYAADLTVIAFAPYEGTGNETAYKLEDVNFADYPLDTGSLPRSKQAMHSEVHLTLAAARLDEANTDPIPFAGSLDLVGINPQTKRLQRLGFLGQDPYSFMTSLIFRDSPGPLVTSTTGYKRGERFGDPHAVSNSRLLQAVQVAGFIGLTPKRAAKQYDIVTLLGADIHQASLT